MALWFALDEDPFCAAMEASYEALMAMDSARLMRGVKAGD